MVTPQPARRETILRAAFVQFMRYGFKRTSMEDIARETELSRASLYRHFANKEEIFRSLAEDLHEQAAAAAETALKAPRPLPDRVLDALLGKTERFLDVVYGSPHGAELVDESSRLCGDLAVVTDRRVRKQLTEALRAGVRSGEIDFSDVGLTAVSAADLLVLATAGIKRGATDVDDLRTRLRQFVRVFFAGLSTA